MNAEIKLKQIESEAPNLQYLKAKKEVVRLQKQLLSCSAINKPNLELKIKEQLKLAEYEMFAHHLSNRSFDIAFLKEYIKETYE